MLGSPLGAVVLQAGLPEPSQPPEEVRRLADDVLGRPEFRRPAPSIFERLQEWVAEQLARVFEGLAGGGRGSLVGLVVLVLAVVAVVVLATRAARTVSFEPRARPAERPDRALTAPQWLDAADRAEAAGDWREGLRCRHRALVARLADEGVIDDVAGRTAGEYRREVGRALPGAAGEFADATDLFERAWYGATATGPEERARFGALAGQVLERVGR